MKRGPLIIVSGPSGSGKSTIIKRLLDDSGLPLHLSVSATTRDRREGEIDGFHYHFWTREQFLAERDRGGFLEWAEVYGNLYGTPFVEVEPHRAEGTGVILDIDVQGAQQVRSRCPDSVSLFLLPPSLAELERRLRRRGSEDEARLQRRLRAAEAEMAHAGEYDRQIINDDLDRTVAQVWEWVAELFERGNHAG
jgi:guanylate kinase